MQQEINDPKAFSELDFTSFFSPDMLTPERTHHHHLDSRAHAHVRVPNVRTLQALTVEEQMEELSALFNVADFNNDGSVDKYELVRLIGCCVVLRGAAAWCRCVVLLRGAAAWCC